MLRNLFLFVPFLLLVHVTSALALPPCGEGYNPAACEATRTFANGSKYVGEWWLQWRHGQGTMFWSNGEVWVGRFWNDKWLSGNKYKAGNVPPEVYAASGRDAPPPIEPPPSDYTPPPPTPASDSMSIDKAKSECEELGFEPKTEKFGECVLILTN